MDPKKIFTTILIWLPSVIITLFFIPNALDKILHSSEMNKIVSNKTILIITGLFLLIATAYKGKPYEVAILIVMATIFAAYIRSPFTFQQKRNY